MVMPKQNGLTADIADLPTGGEITLPAGTVAEQYRGLNIAQTTAGQVVTIPDPSNASVTNTPIILMNTGSSAFVAYGRTVSPGTLAIYAWNGTAYARSVDEVGAVETQETLTPTGLNAVPDLAAGVAAGTVARLHINGQREVTGVAVSAAGVITLTPATIGYDVDGTDEIVVDYTPA